MERVPCSAGAQTDYTWTGGCLTSAARPSAATDVRKSTPHGRQSRCWSRYARIREGAVAGNTLSLLSAVEVNMRHLRPGGRARSRGCVWWCYLLRFFRCPSSPGFPCPRISPGALSDEVGTDERMILRQLRLVAPRLARRLSARTLDTPFISDSIPVRASSVG